MKFFMKKIFRYGIIATLPVLLSCGGGRGEGANADGTISISLNPPENTKYLFSSDVKQTVTVMGMATAQNMLMEYSYEVTAAEGANKTMRVMYDHIKMEMTTMGRNMVYDSKDSKSDHSIYGAMDSMIGKSFEVTIDPEGKILDLKGWDKVMGSASGGPANMIDENTVKQMLETNINVYPNGPVIVGDQWKKSATTNVQMMTMTVNATYTLKEVKNGMALIKMEGKINMDPSADTTLAKGMNMNVNMSGEQSGTLHIELKTGRITTADIKQHVKGSMSMGGQEMPMEINSDISLSTRPL